MKGLTLQKSSLHQTAFTLIELLVVVGMISVLCSIGIPAVFRAVQKRDPLTQSVFDVMDACAQARATAIIRCTPMVVKFHPYEYTFQVEEMPRDINESMNWGNSASLSGSTTNKSSMKSAPYKSTQYQLNDEVQIEMLDVNMTEHMDDDQVISRFFPNGTADLMTVVLSWQGDFRRVTVDMVTGLADFDNLNELATPKNPLRRRRGGIEF
ncbi:MAG: prepilin-type N-terminal cleavage/methylation domain-containing protein [Verrucomicrobia bacterium]|nr:prepilin-type N-terminal cleavage/methylation domain-containing protein [Verrucomicrobiota bacterium]